MKMHLFFTLNDFKNDGGSTIRMKGIVNALAEADQRVVLFSNAETHGRFHSSIKHIFLGVNISKKQKRIFQFCIALLPNIVNKFIFKSYLITISGILKKEKFKINRSIIFFEYLDNSMALFLNKQNIIGEYINDVHGSARLEFLHKRPNTLLKKCLNMSKYVVAIILDRRMYKNANKIIFLSEAMKEYFEKYYNFIASNDNYVIRDGVSRSQCRKIANKNSVEKYKKSLNISPKDRVVMFAGSFKDLGGVLDLLKSFNFLVREKKMHNLKLLLLGDGECYKDAKRFISINQLEERVIMIGRTPYSELKNYQELADVIVCPDKQHPLSELVPHIKYFDSLVSEKIVINGSFASISSINKNECISVNFNPSDIDNLTVKIEMVLADLDSFRLAYRFNHQKICTEFSYSNSVKVLINDRPIR